MERLAQLSGLKAQPDPGITYNHESTFYRVNMDSQDLGTKNSTRLTALARSI